jgi:CubicO group peptidase (beta-lactamase class C family)
MKHYIFMSVWLLIALPVKADHQSAETILAQTKQYLANTYALQPAQKVRELPLSADKDSHRLKADLASLSKGVFSVLMFENGAVVSENYANGAAAHTPVNLYSAAKSLTSLAVGEALCAGKIKSLDDLATVYVPALQGTAYGAASIRNLLGYTSGAKNPGGTGFSGEHSIDDFRAMLRQEISLLDLMKKHGDTGWLNKPGGTFVYNGLDSETLSLVIRGATGLPLPKWFESTVWQKAGGEYAAAWYTDKEGNGVAEAFVWATPRDFLRIGLYALERLTNQSSDACMNAYVQEAAKPRTYKGDYWKFPAPHWGFGMHIGTDKTVWFMGHGGQRLAMNPNTGRILVMNGFKEWRGMDADLLQLFNR